MTGIWSGGWKPGFIKSGILRKKEEEEIPSSKETTKQEQEVQNIEENPTPGITTEEKLNMGRIATEGQHKSRDYKGTKLETLTLKDGGGEYDGELLGGKFHGSGSCKWVSKVDGLPPGHPNGSQYSGLWKNGLMHGKGSIYLAESGETFDGEFKDGNLYHGMLTKSNGEKIRLINGKLEEKPTDLL